MVNDFVGNTGTVDEDGEFHSYNDRPSLVLKDGEQHFHNHGALYKKLYVDGTYDLFDGGVRVVRVEPGKGKTIYDGDQILRVVNESGDVLEYRDGKEWSGISTDISGAKVFWEGGKLVRRIGLDGKVYHYDDGKLRSVQ
jgi:hypothetical protein